MDGEDINAGLMGILITRCDLETRGIYFKTKNNDCSTFGAWRLMLKDQKIGAKKVELQ